MTARPRLTVATTFPVHPPRGGGQARVVGLYGGLAARGVDVDVVVLVPHHERAGVTEIAPGLREVRVPKSAEHEAAESALHAQLGVPVTDVGMALFGALTPAYGAALREHADGSRAVAACHPYVLDAVLEHAHGLPVIYEAQDVETDLKTSMFAHVDGAAAAEVLAAVRDVEHRACDAASLTITCSVEDGRRLSELFDADPGRLAVVPNGCACAAVPFTAPERRDELRRTVGLDGFTVLFVGSWHGPNLEAARAVIAAARELPDTHFVVVGSAGQALAGDDAPANVDLTGPVHEGFLQSVLALAHVAVNPMRSGSGTNLKVLEYAAAGVPLVSSAFGTRGLGFVAGKHYLQGEPDTLAQAIVAVREGPAADTGRRVRLAYDRVTTAFDWPAIAGRWLAHPFMTETFSA